MPLEGAGETAGEEGAGAGAEVGAGAGGMVLAMPLPLADINNIETPGLSSSSFRLRGIPYPTSHIPLIGAHYPPANGWGCGKYENKSAAEGSGNWDWGTNIYPHSTKHPNNNQFLECMVTLCSRAQKGHIAYAVIM